MTMHDIRQHQRLRSEEERQAHEAMVRAQAAELKREEAAARRALRRWLIFGAAVVVGWSLLTWWRW